MHRACWATQVFSATQMLGIQKDAAKKLVNALDQNCDGSIQYLEFCAACLLASTDELYALLSQAPAWALHPKLLTQKPCLPCFLPCEEFQALCAGEKGDKPTVFSRCACVYEQLTEVARGKHCRSC